MQSSHTDPNSTDFSNHLIHTASVIPASFPVAEELNRSTTEPTYFYSHFTDCMEMYADAATVAGYLDAHPEWFPRCASPMRVETIGRNSYALVIGRFGSFGYEIEPKIGLNLLPQQEGVYRIETVPIPDTPILGYDVDFKAALELVEINAGEAAEAAKTVGTDKITRVQWQLDLTVQIQFPRFIHALPMALIQNTGDRLLRQVVRQVSSRLTYKVQEDFHRTRGLLLPKRSRRWFSRQTELDLASPPEGLGELGNR
jgi:hypothetical protein